jgi:hypothetical protein
MIVATTRTREAKRMVLGENGGLRGRAEFEFFVILCPTLIQTLLINELLWPEKIKWPAPMIEEDDQIKKRALEVHGTRETLP